MKASEGRPLGGGACLSRISGLVLSNKSIRQTGALQSGETPERRHFFAYTEMQKNGAEGVRSAVVPVSLEFQVCFCQTNQSDRQVPCRAAKFPAFTKEPALFIKYECDYSASRRVSSDPWRGFFCSRGIRRSTGHPSVPISFTIN